jgi:hypothetical protein
VPAGNVLMQLDVNFKVPAPTATMRAVVIDPNDPKRPSVDILATIQPGADRAVIRGVRFPMPPSGKVEIRVMTRDHVGAKPISPIRVNLRTAAGVDNGTEPLE